MSRWTTGLVPTVVVLACVGGTVLLTGGLGSDGPAAPSGVAAVGDGAGTGSRAPGPLAGLLPEPAALGYGWVAQPDAASQQITDGDGLVHPCGVTYGSDAQRLEVLRSNVAQDERDVPGGMAMTFELARYSGDGALQALQERAQALQDCRQWRRTFAGYADTPVEAALVAPPSGGASTGAHLAVTPSARVGVQAVEYTWLVARQGDLLLSAVVGNGNGQGAELDAFAAGYFERVRAAVAGRPDAGSGDVPVASGEQGR